MCLKIIDVELERAKSPERSLQAAAQQSQLIDSRDDDDVPFLADCDADVAQSILPGDFDIEDDAEVAFLLLSLYESREEEDSLPRKGELDECASFAVGAACGISTGSSVSSSKHCSRSRVRFAPDLVTVIEIPSHRSLTSEEKRAVYRDNRTLQAEKDVSRAERNFDRSRRCLENSLEEKDFFLNQFGELVHPAHWDAFVRHVLPNFGRDRPLPSGFSSRRAYYRYLTKYSIWYDAAVEADRFELPVL